MTASPRLLCVDDEPDGLEMMSRYFAAHGFAVRTAANGLEAIFEVKRWTPRVVILDLFMPRLGGLGALERIRKINPGVVIVLIGGDSQVLDMATQAGVCVAGSFAKPLDLPRVMEMLHGIGVAPAKAEGAGVPAAEARGRSRRRILVVDDDPDVGAVLVEYLTGRGFDTTLALSGEEALERAPALQPDFVLLDITMPGIGGVESLKQIKALLPQTCVVMVSANQDVDVAQQTLAIGAADYIPKPVDFGYLDSVLEIHSLIGPGKP